MNRMIGHLIHLGAGSVTPMKESHMLDYGLYIAGEDSVTPIQESHGSDDGHLVHWGKGVM